MRKTLARPNCQFQTCLQIKEGNSTVFEFFSDNTFRIELQTITIKSKGAIKIVNTRSYNSNVECWQLTHGDKAEHIHDLLIVSDVVSNVAGFLSRAVYFFENITNSYSPLCYNLRLRGVAQPGSALRWG